MLEPFEDNRIRPSGASDGSGWWGQVVKLLRARMMNDAICARVTGLSGQNSNGSALQPVVIPAANRASMSAL